MTSGQNGTPPTTRFTVNLFTLRSLLIFGAGFALALLLARTSPSSSLFHPEVQSRTRILHIINLAGTTPANLRGFATSEGMGFAAGSSVWESGLLQEAFTARDADGQMSVAAKVSYVELHNGPAFAYRVDRPDR